MVTFLISGLWHGANWTYVIWGGLNGLYLIIELWLTKPLAKAVETVRLNQFPFLLKLMQGTLTFTLICLTWVFFRAQTVQDAFYILTNMTHGFQIQGLFSKLAIAKFDLQIIIISLLILVITEWFQRGKSLITWLDVKPVYVRWSVYVLLGITILLFGAFETNQQFIYFQF